MLVRKGSAPLQKIFTNYLIVALLLHELQTNNSKQVRSPG